MSFELDKELARVTQGLEDIRREVSGRGPAALLAQLNLAERCDKIAAALRRLLRELPPPRPTPPVTRQPIEIEEDAIRPATWRERNFPRKAEPPPDVHKKVPTAATRSVVVTLPEPRFPGAPARRYTIDVPYQVVRKVVLPDPDADPDAEASRRRTRRKPTRRKPKPPPFEYELTPEVRPTLVDAPAVPPDAPLTPAQQAYVDRVEEIKREVRDLTTLIADLGRQVGELVADADALSASGEALKARVAALPAPADITADLDAAGARITAVRNQLPAVEHALNAMEPELPELLRRAQEACPEIA